jgi:hypothetical protein
MMLCCLRTIKARQPCQGAALLVSCQIVDHKVKTSIVAEKNSVSNNKYGM